MRKPKPNRSMPFTSNSPATGNRTQLQLGALRLHLAEALIGKTVDLLSGRAVAHGIVSGVMPLAGHPMLLVNGRAYDLNQVLTAAPL